jgi:transglutaminase-like putative cysteine protease
MENFLAPTYFIDCDHPAITETARNLTRHCADEKEKAVTLFRFARDEIQYNPYGPIFDRERYKASRVLARGYGYCIQKATLLAALLRTLGIPTGLVFCDIQNPLIPQKLRNTMKSDTFIFHCYNRIFIRKAWLNAVCSFDSITCERLNVPPVEFTGGEDALFSTEAPDGRHFVTYLHHRGLYDDVPFENIMQEFRQFYGDDVLASFDNPGS